MSEEGFQYRRAAAYQTSVDLDDTVTSQRPGLGSESASSHVSRKVLASSHAVSGALRFSTRRANRRVVTAQLLGRC